jgi:hypothetical protein
MFIEVSVSVVGDCVILKKNFLLRRWPWQLQFTVFLSALAIRVHTSESNFSKLNFQETICRLAEADLKKLPMVVTDRSHSPAFVDDGAQERRRGHAL